MSIGTGYWFGYDYGWYPGTGTGTSTGTGTGTKLHIQSLHGNEYQVLVGMFACLTGWSVWMHAWVLMGPDIYY